MLGRCSTCVKRAERLRGREQLRHAPLTGTRLQSTSSSAPPLLRRLRDDLLVAMRAKDTNRLNVLRAVMAEVTNASKTAKPVNTDFQLLSLLRKRSQEAQEAATSFRNAGRSDLEEKEEAQLHIINQYAAQIQVVSEEEIRESVGRVLEEMEEDAEATNVRVKKGKVMKKLLGPGGLLEGKPVERRVVSDLVDDALGPS